MTDTEEKLLAQLENLRLTNRTILNEVEMTSIFGISFTSADIEKWLRDNSFGHYVYTHSSNTGHSTFYHAQRA